MIDVTPFIGLPFKDNGRTRAGVDCYGAVKLVLNQERGFDPLPDFRDEYENAGDWVGIRRCIEKEKNNWKKVDDPVRGAVIVFNVKGRPHHVGICTGKQQGEAWFFHVYEGTTAKHERLNSTLWSKRISGVYIYG